MAYYQSQNDTLGGLPPTAAQFFVRPQYAIVVNGQTLRDLLQLIAGRGLTTTPPVSLNAFDLEECPRRRGHYHFRFVVGDPFSQENDARDNRLVRRHLAHLGITARERLVLQDNTTPAPGASGLLSRKLDALARAGVRVRGTYLAEGTFTIFDVDDIARARRVIANAVAEPTLCQ